MNKILGVVLAALFLGFLPCGSVMSDEDVIDPGIAAKRITERSWAYEIRKSGARNPNEIPLSITMRVLLRHFDALASELSGTLSEYAISVLKRASEIESVEARTDNAASDGIWDYICQNIDQLDGPDIARQVVSIAEKFAESREYRYLTILNQLAESDVNGVNQYLETVIAPTINMTDVDAIGLATELPREYKVRIRLICEERQLAGGETDQSSSQGLSSGSGEVSAIGVEIDEEEDK